MFTFGCGQGVSLSAPDAGRCGEVVLINRSFGLDTGIDRYRSRVWRRVSFCVRRFWLSTDGTTRDAFPAASA